MVEIKVVYMAVDEQSTGTALDEVKEIWDKKQPKLIQRSFPEWQYCSGQ